MWSSGEVEFLQFNDNNLSKGSMRAEDVGILLICSLDGQRSLET
jgi:hypothetical protein